MFEFIDAVIDSAGAIGSKSLRERSEACHITGDADELSNVGQAKGLRGMEGASMPSTG